MRAKGRRRQRRAPSPGAPTRSPPPWFAFGLSDDGLRRAYCECKHFSNKAIPGGSHPAKAGRVGHLIQVVAIPSADANATGGEIRFLGDLRLLTDD